MVEGILSVIRDMRFLCMAGVTHHHYCPGGVWLLGTLCLLDELMLHLCVSYLQIYGRNTEIMCLFKEGELLLAQGIGEGFLERVTFELGIWG